MRRWETMMPASDVMAIDCYQFNPDEGLLFDANVWLFLYGPQKPRDWKVGVYSKAFSKILSAGCMIYVDLLVVSEFINRYARIKHYQVPHAPDNFKEFRQSPEYKQVAKSIAADITRVLQHCERIDSGFASLDITGLVETFASGDSDFNDQIIAATCQRMGLKLVTHDADFRDKGVPLLTANKRLLS